MSLKLHKLYKYDEVICFCVYENEDIVTARYFYSTGRAAVNWTVGDEVWYDVYRDVQPFTKVKAREVWWTLVEQGWLRVPPREAVV
jgi:hypothetical protein